MFASRRRKKTTPTGKRSTSPLKTDDYSFRVRNMSEFNLNFGINALVHQGILTSIYFLTYSSSHENDA